jgi:ElaB/YqjD/DUF883 family membrane-anchored ribosome-binding protein
MDPNTYNPNNPTGTVPSDTPTGETKRFRDQEPGRAEEVWRKGPEVYDQTKQAVTQAYDKTADVVSKTYDQAMEYGRNNPGKLTLIAFGAGIGVGLLLAANGGGRSRTRRYAEPVVNAVYDIALEFFGRR